MVHAEYIQRKRKAYRISGKNQEERNHSEDLCINGSYKQDGNV